uniref:Ribonuclease H protein At1g65750 family n=1 Tax=Cajanus cajan TaxID=3821 RepID=A0A151RV32_CAJCA|nr:Putative ribonuclease H protein At1g65750 family [Cajanus cajan]
MILVEGLVVINCNGIITEGRSKLGCGYVLQDHTRRFIAGYISNLGGCSMLVEELKTILLDLQFTWSKGYRRICINSDSQLIIRLPALGCCNSHPYFNIMKSIHNVHNNSKRVIWNHVLKKTNQPVDRLAMYALLANYDFHVFHFAHIFVIHKLIIYVTQTCFP